MTGPVVVGSGHVDLRPQAPVALRVVGTRTWDESGNVLVRYEVSERRA
jgi:hypothetical protein